MKTDSPDRPVLLLLTVGGSAEPLKTALARFRPDEALFIVSDGAGGTKSSADAVKDLKDCEGWPARHRVLPVPVDGLDRAFALIETQLAMAQERGCRVIADYTGGTKSMSAALAMAARLLGGVELYVTTGDRRDLVRVVDGTEAPMAVEDRLFGLRQRLKVTEELVGERNYAAALAVVPEGDLPKESAPKRWRSRLTLWRDWLRLMERWDRFDHGQALELVDRNGGAGRSLGQALAEAGLLERLRALAEAKRRPSAALCEDLWWNAHRRADLGAYDDAVARLYRLAEAAIQARLFMNHGIDTAAVPPERLSEAFRSERPNLKPHAETGSCQLALSDALALLAELEPASPVPGFWANGTPEWQSRRNHSILAHGFSPLAAKDWNKARAWFEGRVAVLWRELSGGAEACQLPNRLPAI